MFKIGDKVRFIKHDSDGFSKWANCRRNVIYTIIQINNPEFCELIKLQEFGNWWLHSSSFELLEHLKPREFSIVQFCRNNYKDYR